MKKYRFIKQFKNISTTSLYNEEWRHIWDVDCDEIKNWGIHELMLWMIMYKDSFKEYIEEYIEEPKPKFKVWDYAVLCHLSTEYLKINRICKNTYSYLYNWYKEEDLRSPTKEELEKYFR